jgi:PAS domain S-box-containing protein
VISNDYAAPDPLKKGYPEGHVRVLRHMNVPVFDGRRIVAVAGVGNKDEPYDESDIRQLTLLMQGMWRLIQRRCAEEALLAGEARLRQIIDMVPHFIFAKDRQGRFLLVNRALADAYGTTVEELVGKRDADFHASGEELNHFLANDRAVIESGRPKFTPEEAMVDVHGRHRVLQTTKIPFMVPGSEECAVLGVSTDITDLKEAEEDLREAHDELEIRVQERTAELAGANEELKQERSLLHTLMDHLPHAIYFKDSTSHFLRINKALAGYFGLSDASEAVGKTDLDFFSDEHALQAMADEQEILRSGQPMLDKEEKETWPDGRTTWAATTKMPLYNGAGQIIGTFGISRDVTERKQAGEALRAAKEAAEAASRAKSIFLANMSHEIRTPMNAILGMTELVLESPLSPQQREFLQAVQESGEALLTVINDILDFSKIEAGKLSLDAAPFDLAENLGDTMKSLAVRAHGKGLELAYHFRPGVPTAVVGDRVRLRQIIVNLVGNAIKFTDRGEVVLDVALESQADGEVELHFAVADTGIGIPEEKRAVIFDAFEQADNTTTRRFGGTGLGLAIAARLSALMGGRIWVESEVGRGSSFHFTARFALAEVLPAAVPPAPPAAVCGTSVLVVDDNATNRRILEEMLSNWGMLPTAVPGARQALETLRQAHRSGQAYHLILADASMPEIDGFTLAEQVKQDPELGSTVILMLSSMDHPGNVARCDRLGIVSYLLKPIKQSELFDAILMALGVTAVEDPGPEPPAAERPGRLRPLRILLAEDSLVNQKVAVSLLEREGHTVVVANNGREAIAAAESAAYDLILMDVQMPEMDGLEATGAIRARQRQTGLHVPIIAMTAHAMQGDRERCLEAGMDQYLAKPIRARQLLAMIETVLGPAADSPGPPLAAGPAQEDVDWPAALAAVEGDQALLRAVVEAFLEESPRLMAAIRQAGRNGDADALYRAAHTLQGALRHFAEGPAFHDACRLEQMGRSGDLHDAEPVRASLEAGTARLTEALLTCVRQPD